MIKSSKLVRRYFAYSRRKIYWMSTNKPFFVNLRWCGGHVRRDVGAPLRYYQSQASDPVI